MALKPVLTAAVNGLFLRWLGEEGTIEFLLDNLQSIVEGQFIAQSPIPPKPLFTQKIPPSRNKVFYFIFKANELLKNLI